MRKYFLLGGPCLSCCPLTTAARLRIRWALATGTKASPAPPFSVRPATSRFRPAKVRFRLMAAWLILTSVGVAIAAVFPRLYFLES